MNIERDAKFSQVCVWPGTLVGKKETNNFVEFIKENSGVRVQYLEEIVTFPNLDEYENPVKDTGGRNDLFFAVHQDDIAHFALPRLALGIRWIEDVLAECNYSSPIYPERVFEYRSW